jgi:hypothetical protein
MTMDLPESPESFPELKFDGDIESDLAGVDVGADAELVLMPPSGRSLAERESYAKTFPPVTDAALSEPRRFQFPISTLMLVSLAIAVGLAGRTWVPAKVFAGLLAVVANILVFSCEINDVDNPFLRRSVILTCVACGIAICVALFS